MTHPFDEAVTLEHHGSGRFTVRTHPAYANMVGPFGGITVGAIMQALLSHEDAVGEPVALTVNFTAPIADGTWDLQADAVRTNRSNQHWTFTGTQGDAVVVTGTAILAARRDTFSTIEAVAPRLPDPEDLPVTDLTSFVVWPGNYEMRFAEGATAGLGAEPSDSSLSSLWIRQRPDRTWDHAALACAADAFTPRVFQRLGPTVAGTITMTVYFHATAAELAEQGRWLAATARASRFHGGVFDQFGELWGADESLLATTHQLVYFRDPVP